MIVALTQSRQRLRDYAAHGDHSRFLAEELVPALEARYPLQKGAASRGLMGASQSGVKQATAGAQKAASALQATKLQHCRTARFACLVCGTAPARSC